MSSIEDMFAQAFEKANVSTSSKKFTNKVTREGSYPYDTLEACWNRGSLIGALIPDSNGVPFKTLNRVMVSNKWILSDDEGKLRVMWCDNSNYKCELTEEQIKLNNEINNEINKFKDSSPDNDKLIKYIGKLSLFYFSLAKYVPSNDEESQVYPNPDTTLVIHRSKAFIDAFKTAIKSNNESEEDASWMNDYFNRDVGPHSHFVTINTDQPEGKGGYQVSINFKKFNKLEIKLDEANIEKANDLDKEFINTLEYDMTYNKRLLAALKATNASNSEVNKMNNVEEPKVSTVDEDLKNV